MGERIFPYGLKGRFSMSGAPPAGSSTLSRHSGQWLIVGSKTTPHIGHFFGRDSRFKTHVWGGVRAGAGVDLADALRSQLTFS